MKYVFFIDDHYSYPIVKHLLDEGQDVTAAIVKDRSKYISKRSEPSVEDKFDKFDLECYEGIVKKRDTDDVLKEMKSVKDKDSYFFFFDGNEFYKIAEELLKMGFRNGLMPTSLYNRFESDRDLGKKIVEKFYKDISVADRFVFKKVEDGIKKIEGGNDIYVLKGNGDFGETVVPTSDNVEISKKLIINILNKYKTEYEKAGFVLEKKIVGGLEVSPTLVFWNGKPVYSVAEVESKQFGAGNIGVMKGGNIVLSVQTDIDCKLNKMAFPDIIYKLAAKQPGFAIYDAGLLLKDDKFYFLEYCGMRPGYDSIYAQMSMSSDGGRLAIEKYFSDIMSGKNPLKNKYGAAVRLFNIEGDREKTFISKSERIVLWDEKVNDSLFLYRIKKSGDNVVVVGGLDFFGAMTGVGKTAVEAADNVYKNIDLISFERLYYRPKFDFLSTDYQTSLMNRLKAVEKFI